MFDRILTNKSPTGTFCFSMLTLNISIVLCCWLAFGRSTARLKRFVKKPRSSILARHYELEELIRLTIGRVEENHRSLSPSEFSLDFGLDPAPHPRRVIEQGLARADASGAFTLTTAGLIDSIFEPE